VEVAAELAVIVDAVMELSSRDGIIIVGEGVAAVPGS
jgi:hypothetical protein